MSGDGDITVWINSPGGDCVAAAQIYNMLMDYPHDVTIKIDGIAASAASVIAMAGTKVLVSPVSMMMIHNPMTVAMGDTAEMQKAIEMLGSVKDSIINAYEIKTGLSRAKLSHLMDAETSTRSTCDCKDNAPPVNGIFCVTDNANCSEIELLEIYLYVPSSFK